LDRSAGAPKLHVVRIPRERTSPNTIATVRQYAGEFGDPNTITAASVLLNYSTAHYGEWKVKDVLRVDLGGDPGYEIRFEPAAGSGTDSRLVASDFIQLRNHIWVMCFPMSPDDLVECRKLASPAATR
jgi:hypothetical protein